MRSEWCAMRLRCFVFRVAFSHRFRERRECESLCSLCPFRACAALNSWLNSFRARCASEGTLVLAQRREQLVGAIRLQRCDHGPPIEHAEREAPEAWSCRFARSDSGACSLDVLGPARSATNIQKGLVSTSTVSVFLCPLCGPCEKLCTCYCQCMCSCLCVSR